MFTRKDFLTGGAALAAAGVLGENAKGKAALAQLSEDLKILYTEGILFKRLEGFCLEMGQAESRIVNMKTIFMDTFMRSLNSVKLKKLINTDCRQTSAWGGSMVALQEELQTLCDNGYCYKFL